MRQHAVVTLAAVVGLAALAGVAWRGRNEEGRLAGAAPAEAALPLAPLATPPGVTVQEVRVGESVIFAGMSAFAQEKLAYGSASGMTLYTYDGDTIANRSSCTGDCAREFVPATVPAGAEGQGDWGIVLREDGIRQWSHRGKPLYSYAKDRRVGDANGKNLNNEWHVLLVDPTAGRLIPDEIGIQEVAGANGMALVNRAGMALYAFDGAGAEPDPLLWAPVRAAEIARPAGDFAPADGADGSRQWAWQARKLFSFKGDVEIGDANGMGRDPHLQVALVERYFLPPEAALRLDQDRGAVLTTRSGMTLYSPERTTRPANGGHSARGGTRGDRNTGMAIGLTGCNAECEKIWRPFLAGDDAQTQGYWSVLTRPDGHRQWAFQGYALYTYAGDRQPGDMLGHDRYEKLLINDRSEPDSHGLRLYWRFAAQTSPFLGL